MTIRLMLWILIGLSSGVALSGPSSIQDFKFDASSGISNRLITPNGDGLNDTTVFTFHNPQVSQITGRIYDLKGAHVSDMTDGPAVAWPQDTLQWNGKSGGAAVASGVYIYVIEAEDQVHTGTLVVIR